MSYNSKLYYGSGDCTIEGQEIRAIQINYKGSILITKTAGDNFAITANDQKIIIFPVGEGFLNDLFTYTGEIKITSAIVADNNAEKVSCIVKRSMDFPELMGNSEDLTINSERMNAGYRYKGKVGKTKVLEGK